MLDILVYGWSRASGKGEYSIEQVRVLWEKHLADYIMSSEMLIEISPGRLYLKSFDVISCRNVPLT
jgi:hypothetical protein